MSSAVLTLVAGLNPLGGRPGRQTPAGGSGIFVPLGKCEADEDKDFRRRLDAALYAREFVDADTTHLGFGDYCEAFAVRLLIEGLGPEFLVADVYSCLDGMRHLQVPLKRQDARTEGGWLYVAQMGGRAIRTPERLLVEIRRPEGGVYYITRYFGIHRFIPWDAPARKKSLLTVWVPVPTIPAHLRIAADVEALALGRRRGDAVVTDLVWRPGQVPAVRANEVAYLIFRDPLAEAALALLEGAPGRMHVGWLSHRRLEFGHDPAPARAML